ncbi:iron-siderophore ABC transporter substrate-binding protein [Actinosynnema pretiosum subsp. pretiosum]|uniref:Periplasmic binding protein n=2 Tax=Actinosynnema TaxID=40566 RepID=C6WGF0_ACTMD|nr:iron-siderophore ABC transporter substrate-binding protein [Actinosynnema mirum]ACU34266.1 periplasmic binding protein [Actinosynnema mirum DSM 43827]QUF01658.1 iron-siderophore ABC transporter substrate-binding protein [Actinosynnema pretiosum subsp. pretiosum]
MRLLTPALLAAAVLLSACGTTESTSSEPSASGDAGGAITLTDARGKTVELKAPAKKVVSLEWAETEMVLTLGVTPVGAADPEGYATWNAAEALPGDVKDVGKRGEPSVDAIVALEPDLVLMPLARDTAVAEQLEKAVPVVMTKSSDATKNFDRLREDFTLIAKAVGKEAEAKTALAEMDAKLAEGKKAVEAKGATGTPFVMADGWMQGSTVSIRPFGKGSLVSDTAEAVGLVNAWTGEVDAEWGLGATDVEGMTAITDPKTIMVYSASEEDVFTTGLKDNAVWQRLPFTASGKITKLEKGTWTFGGPKSVAVIADQFVKAATS